MRFCDLKQKEVINICDCQRLGYVCDLEFNPQNGCIEALIVPGPCKIWGILGSDSEYFIDYCCIKQIGGDVILVDINPEKALRKC